MNFQRTSRILAVIALATLAAPAIAASNVIASKTGMTLYTFDKDSAGKSNCQAGCLALWPAAPVADAPKANDNWGSIQRDDGSKQLTFKGKPVYYYIHDKKPGDVSGDNVGGVWHVIAAGKPEPAKETSSGGYGSSYGGYSY